MPHLIVEYSANLEPEVDIAELIRVLHVGATRIEALPTGGIRSRAVRRGEFRIADGHTDNRFINVILRISRGRTIEIKKSVGEELFEILADYVQHEFEQRPLALSFEIQEIDPDVRWKKSNIREHMEKRRNV